jgi:hypothetical protein
MPGGLKAMSKLSSLAKDHVRNKCYDKEAEDYVYDSYIDGFEAAFKIMGEELNKKMTKMEQYPMMGERIFAIKTYIKTMEEMLEEMKSNE